MIWIKICGFYLVTSKPQKSTQAKVFPVFPHYDTRGQKFPFFIFFKRFDAALFCYVEKTEKLPIK